MPQLIGLMVLVTLGGLWLGSGTSETPVDRRIMELSARQAELQSAQNERLAAFQQQWQAERAELYQQRDQLEADRRELAVDRQQAPIVAESIQQIGMLALSLLPLAVCALLLWRVQESDDANAVSETLVADLMSPHPTLFGRETPGSPSPSGRLESAGHQPHLKLESPNP